MAEWLRVRNSFGIESWVRASFVRQITFTPTHVSLSVAANPDDRYFETTVVEILRVFGELVPPPTHPEKVEAH